MWPEALLMHRGQRQATTLRSFLTSVAWLIRGATRIGILALPGPCRPIRGVTLLSPRYSCGHPGFYGRAPHHARRRTEQ